MSGERSSHVPISERRLSPAQKPVKAAMDGLRDSLKHDAGELADEIQDASIARRATKTRKAVADLRNSLGNTTPATDQLKESKKRASEKEDAGMFAERLAEGRAKKASKAHEKHTSEELYSFAQKQKAIREEQKAKEKAEMDKQVDEAYAERDAQVRPELNRQDTAMGVDASVDQEKSDADEFFSGNETAEQVVAREEAEEEEREFRDLRNAAEERTRLRAAQEQIDQVVAEAKRSEHAKVLKGFGLEEGFSGYQVAGGILAGKIRDSEDLYKIGPDAYQMVVAHFNKMTDIIEEQNKSKGFFKKIFKAKSTLEQQHDVLNTWLEKNAQLSRAKTEVVQNAIGNVYARSQTKSGPEGVYNQGTNRNEYIENYRTTIKIPPNATRRKMESDVIADEIDVAQNAIADNARAKAPTKKPGLFQKLARATGLAALITIGASFLPKGEAPVERAPETPAVEDVKTTIENPVTETINEGKPRRMSMKDTIEKISSSKSIIQNNDRRAFLDSRASSQTARTERTSRKFEEPKTFDISDVSPTIARLRTIEDNAERKEVSLPNEYRSNVREETAAKIAARDAGKKTILSTVPGSKEPGYNDFSGYLGDTVLETEKRVEISSSLKKAKTTLKKIGIVLPSDVLTIEQIKDINQRISVNLGKRVSPIKHKEEIKILKGLQKLTSRI